MTKISRSGRIQITAVERLCAPSNEADDGGCRLRESDAIESLKGVNIKNFRLRSSTKKTRTPSIHPHINCWCLPFVVACLLPRVCLFAFLADYIVTGSSRMMCPSARVNFWLPLFVFKGTTAALHWRWRAIAARGWADRDAPQKEINFFRFRLFETYSQGSMHQLIFDIDLGCFNFCFLFISFQFNDDGERMMIGTRASDGDSISELKVWLIHRHDRGAAPLHYSSIVIEKPLPSIINYYDRNRGVYPSFVSTNLARKQSISETKTKVPLDYGSWILWRDLRPCRDRDGLLIQRDMRSCKKSGASSECSERENQKSFVSSLQFLIASMTSLRCPISERLGRWIRWLRADWALHECETATEGRLS